MYTDRDFPTKKALKEAVKAGQSVGVYQPNDAYGVTERTQHGTHVIYLEGPHYPRPHTWYAKATVTDGVVTKVQ